MYGEKNSVVPRKSRFPFLGVSLLVLSLLLICCVGGLIYMSISNQQLCQRKQVLEEVDMEADVTVSSDNQKKQEKITYNQESRVAYYRGEDGSFEVDDFSKGIHIIRAPGNKVCYVIPIGAESSSNHGFESFLQRSSEEGQMKVNETINVSFKILPGDITDTSFIPPGAHSECTNGYKWMVVFNPPKDIRREKRQVELIAAQADFNATTSIPDAYTNSTTTAEVTTNSAITTTESTELECTYCYLFYVQDSTSLSLYESCFTIIGFEFCHVLYSEGERPDLRQEMSEKFS